MKLRPAIHALVLGLAIAGLAGCGDDERPEAAGSTAVLGGFGAAPKKAASEPLVDSQGRPIPRPPAPRSATVQVVPTGADAAVAVWEQDHHVVTASYAAGRGWTPSVPLEEIYGEAGAPQLAGNGQGAALAVWQHTVGSIQSLRFSRFDATTGWSVPDVMPGALPRPPSRLAGASAPELHMDAQGNAFAQWPSGFADNEVQTSRYTAGQGWTRALSEPVTATAPPSAGQPASTVQ